MKRDKLFTKSYQTLLPLSTKKSQAEIKTTTSQSFYPKNSKIQVYTLGSTLKNQRAMST